MSQSNLKNLVADNSNKANFKFSLETPSISSGTLDKYLKSVLGTDSSNNLPEILRSVTELQQQQAAASGGSGANNNFSDLESSADMSLSSSSNSSGMGLSSSSNATPVQVTTVPAVVVTTQAQPQQAMNTTIATLSNVSQARPSSTTEIVQALPLSNVQQLQMPSMQQSQQQSSMSTAMTTTGETGNEVIPLPKGQAYLDITEYLNMPQSEAAKKLGIPPSTLSKRWKEAVRKRKWPFRMVGKIDKEIMTLLHNVPQGSTAPPLPEEIEQALGQLLRRRQDELRPVVIRI